MAADISKISGSFNPEILEIRGELESGDERKFVRVALPVEQGVVPFNSEGGNLVAGIEIGKAIRLKQFYTLVTKVTYCASACALAWIAGVRRFMEPGSRIGFHAAYIMENGEARESGVANALVGGYLAQLGLASDAIVYITTAAPNDMKWLDASEAIQHGIPVEVVPGENVYAPQELPPSDLWNVRRGIDLSGFDLTRRPHQTPDATQCEADCRETSLCTAFTFNTKHSACFLKHNAEIVYRNGNAVSGFKTDIEHQLRLSPFIISEDYDFDGRELRSVQTSSLDKCVDTCFRDQTCQAFVYSPAAKQCDLKSGANLTPVTGRGMVSGVRDESPDSDDTTLGTFELDD